MLAWNFWKHSHAPFPTNDYANSAAGRIGFPGGRTSSRGVTGSYAGSSVFLGSTHVPPTRSIERRGGPEDVLQGCLLRLHQSLAKVRPPNGRAFFGLAARQLGWILADLARKTSRPEVSLSAVTFSNGSEPGIIEPSAPDADPAESVNWVEFHSAASGLPEEIGTVFDLVYYQGLEHAEVAELLEISVRTVKRRWRHARLALDRVLHGDWPSTGE